MKNFKDCPIGEYVRIIKLKDAPVETLTDDELWVLYTKAQDDLASDPFEDIDIHGTALKYLNKFEAELERRGLFTSTQASFFEEEEK